MIRKCEFLKSFRNNWWGSIDKGERVCVKLRLSRKKRGELILHKMWKERHLIMLAFYLTLVDTPEDKDFVEHMYTEYRQFMFLVAKDILKNDEEAEDAVHEAFLRIIEVIDKLRGYDKDHLQASLLVTVRNIALNVVRDEKRIEYVGIFNDETEAKFLGAEGPNVEMAVLNKIEFNEVLGYVRKLTVEEQDLLYMHYVHRTRGKELAKLFNISPANVRKKIDRACQKIEKMMEANGYER